MNKNNYDLYATTSSISMDITAVTPNIEDMGLNQFSNQFSFNQRAKTLEVIKSAICALEERIQDKRYFKKRASVRVLGRVK